MDVVAVPVGNPGPMTGEGNITYLLPGAATVLIDSGTGIASHLEALRQALEAAAGQLTRVVVTHAHADHASGARTLREEWSVTVAKIPWPERDSSLGTPFETLADGDRVPAGDSELVVIHTPGHSPDHACFWHEPSRTLFGGDLLIQGSTVVIPAGRGGRLGDYLRSLERVLALNPTRVLPAHGPVIDDPPALIRSYIAHRQRREEQVLEALRSGPSTVQALVERIYPRLPDALVPMARQSVRAHLEKLHEEGRAAAVDEARWMSA